MLNLQYDYNGTSIQNINIFYQEHLKLRICHPKSQILSVILLFLGILVAGLLLVDLFIILQISSTRLYSEVWLVRVGLLLISGWFTTYFWLRLLLISGQLLIVCTWFMFLHVTRVNTFQDMHESQTCFKVLSEKSVIQLL